MFYYVNGPVAELEPGLAVIDCGGVGYACATTNYTLSQLKKGAPAKLYTYLNVREDAMELFGFIDQNELRSFKLLISVSGVGPRAALAILSAITPQQLALAVVTDDAKALTAAPGAAGRSAGRWICRSSSAGPTRASPTSASSAAVSSVFSSNSRYIARPLPAGISLPMMTFSLRPTRWSTLPLMAASVRTLVVSWKEAADRKLSVARDALVIPMRSWV